MIEYLALPAWQTPPTRVRAWVEKLSEAGEPVKLTRESSTVTWIEAASLRLRGYVVIENGHAAAINFELHDLDPEPARQALQAATDALGWELHEDEDDDEDADDD